MTNVTCDIAVSVDGFAAGPNQRLDEPFGDGVDGRLHRWMFDQPDENAAEIAGIIGAGAYIMGRNMFSAGRGEWDPDWKGWWGDDPMYHAPVFVLTHHPRDPVPMQGGTTYYLVTVGIEAALAPARAGAGAGRVAIAGGAATVNQYLALGAIDELRLHIAPVLLGAGERLFEGVGNHNLERSALRGTDLVTHVTYRAAR